MSNIVSAVRFSCSCGNNSENNLRDSMTVPAGSVGTGLSACGIETELSALPQTYIRPQVYREGFCPDEALAIGTLFPELADTYK